jgi:hypothetical protein
MDDLAFLTTFSVSAYENISIIFHSIKPLLKPSERKIKLFIFRKRKSKDHYLTLLAFIFPQL